MPGRALLTRCEGVLHGSLQDGARQRVKSREEGADGLQSPGRVPGSLWRAEKRLRGGLEEGGRQPVPLSVPGLCGSPERPAVTPKCGWISGPLPGGAIQTETQEYGANMVRFKHIRLYFSNITDTIHF